MTNLVAVIETKSNYKGLNGTQVNVKSFHGSLVYVSHIDETGTEIFFDVSLSEIKSIKEK